MRSTHRRILGVLTVASMLIGLGPVALADNVQNDVVSGGNDTFAAGGSATVNYSINANNGDGQTGCNAADATPATVTINAPAGVTAVPSSVNFTNCASIKAVTFSSNTPGDHVINVSVSDSGVGTYNTNSARFTLRVTGAANTPPVLSLPADITAEATGPSGAAVSFTASATDTEDTPDPVPNCSPASGAVFPLGSTTVSCSVLDSKGLSDSGSFEVNVVDTTGPIVIAPGNLTVEATGPTGAIVTYSGQSASDAVDGSLTPTCSPASGGTFALGDNVVTCTATDTAGNPGSATFTIKVTDTTAPALLLPAPIVEATGPSGAVVIYTASASDLVDGTVAVSCAPASGTAFPLGTTTVACSATDAHNNTASSSFTVTVRDTTPPVVTVSGDIVAEATSAAGAAVSYSGQSATDLVSGSITPTCVPASGSTFALGTTTVTCSATDAAGNTGTGSFDVTVEDTTAPTLNLPADIPVSAASGSSAVVTYTASASDLVDGSVPVTCTPPSGSTFTIGTTVVTCTATDFSGNTATGSFSVTVSYTWAGFFQPIDNLPALNKAKSGSAIPVKFSLGGNQGLSIFANGYPRSVAVPCASTSVADDIEQTVTAGGSSLSYDAAANQYVYVWKTDKAWAGTCRQLQVKLADGTVHAANFTFTK